MRQILLISGKFYDRATTINALIDKETSGVIVNQYNVDNVLTEIRLTHTTYSAVAFPNVMYIDDRLNALLYIYGNVDLDFKLIIGGEEMLPKIKNYMKKQRFAAEFIEIEAEKKMIYGGVEPTTSESFGPRSSADVTKLTISPRKNTTIAELIAEQIRFNYYRGQNHLIYLPAIPDMLELKTILSNDYFDQTFNLADYNKHFENKSGLILLTIDEPVEVIPNLGLIIDSGQTPMIYIDDNHELVSSVLPTDTNTCAMRSEMISIPAGKYITTMDVPSSSALMSSAKNLTDISQTLLWMLQFAPTVVRNDLYYTNSLPLYCPPGLPILLFAKSQLLKFHLVNDDLSVVHHPYAEFCLLVPRINWIGVMLDNPLLIHYVLLIISSIEYHHLTVDSGEAIMTDAAQTIDIMSFQEKELSAKLMRDLIKTAIMCQIKLNDRRDLRTSIDLSALESPNLLPAYSDRQITLSDVGGNMIMSRTF